MIHILSGNCHCGLRLGLQLMVVIDQKEKQGSWRPPVARLKRKLDSKRSRWRVEKGSSPSSTSSTSRNAGQGRLKTWQFSGLPAIRSRVKSNAMRTELHLTNELGSHVAGENDGRRGCILRKVVGREDAQTAHCCLLGLWLCEAYRPQKCGWDLQTSMV
jgi:hypothetical protein